MELEGRRALVTGAGIGIGRAVAIELARQGADVALSYHSSAEGAHSAASEIRALGRRAEAFQADLRCVDACFALVDQANGWLGGLDILVNNAGRTDTTPFSLVSPEQFDDLMASNMRSQFFLAQRAASQMAAYRGVIINMASVHALASMPSHTVYEATKGAIVAWTRSLAIELAPLHIRVNAIAPGAIEVPRFYDRPDYTPATMGAAIPWGHVGYPEQVAEACSFLASDRAGYITGTTLVVDGGLTARLALFA